VSERIPRAILGLALLVGLALPQVALADVWANGRLFLGTGIRQSVTHDHGGLDLRIGAGIGIGPLSMELVSANCVDHTFQSEERMAARTTNWLSLAIRIPLTGPLALGIGAGPGLGWIKEAGAATAPNRIPVIGIHEFVRLDLGGIRSAPFFVSLRIEPHHLWQDHLFPGVDHGIAVWFALGAGFSGS